jgi:hypothetical protein
VQANGVSVGRGGVRVRCHFVIRQSSVCMTNNGARKGQSLSDNLRCGRKD